MRQQQKALLQEWPDKALGEGGTGSGNQFSRAETAVIEKEAAALAALSSSEEEAEEDSDAELDFAEFCELAQEEGLGGDLGFPGHGSSLDTAELQRQFAAIDTDGSGTISMSELRRHGRARARAEAVVAGAATTAKTAGACTRDSTYSSMHD